MAKRQQKDFRIFSLLKINDLVGGRGRFVYEIDTPGVRTYTLK
jgi:hypothetical protein